MKARIAGIVFIVLVLISIASVYNGYYSTVYKIDRACGELSRAKTSPNEEIMIPHLKKARNLIDGFSGNPCWIFPTEDTNIDKIKDELDLTIKTLEENPDSSTIDYCKDSCLTFIDQLRNVRDWLFYYNGLNIILACFMALALLISFAYMLD